MLLNMNISQIISDLCFIVLIRTDGIFLRMTCTIPLPDECVVRQSKKRLPKAQVYG